MDFLAWLFIALVALLVLPFFELFFIPVGVFILGAVFFGAEIGFLLAACVFVLSLILMMGWYS